MLITIASLLTCELSSAMALSRMDIQGLNSTVVSNGGTEAKTMATNVLTKVNTRVDW